MPRMTKASGSLYRHLHVYSRRSGQTPAHSFWKFKNPIWQPCRHGQTREELLPLVALEAICLRGRAPIGRFMEASTVRLPRIETTNQVWNKSARERESSESPLSVGVEVSAAGFGILALPELKR